MTTSDPACKEFDFVLIHATRFRRGALSPLFSFHGGDAFSCLLFPFFMQFYSEHYVFPDDESVAVGIRIEHLYPILMPLSPLRKLATVLVSLIGLLFALVGAILLISGTQAYLENDTSQGVPFEQMLLAIGFLGIPVSGVLYYKTRISIQRGLSRYGLPDSPVHSLSLIVITVTSLILTVSAFVIVATVF